MADAAPAWLQHSRNVRGRIHRGRRGDGAKSIAILLLDVGSGLAPVTRDVAHRREPDAGDWYVLDQPLRRARYFCISIPTVGRMTNTASSLPSTLTMREAFPASAK
jgi:hypothetical protein